MSPDLRSARSLTSAYASRAAGVAEVVEESLRVLGAATAELSCVVRLLPDIASELAAASQARWDAGNPRPLEGLPFGIKDVFDLAGVITTSGSLVDRDRVATSTAVAVERMMAAGAIPVSKDATTEWAVGGPHNLLTGATRNPWDTSRWAGGSSCGSAAAVAAGAFPLSLGSDAGGSIRIPAAYCGVTGLKTTAGLVPRTGATPLAWTNETVGSIATSAEDAALMLGVIAGAHPSDPQSTGDRFVPSQPTERLDGIRVGLPGNYFVEGCDGEVLAGYEAQAQHLVALGAELVDAVVPSAADAQVVGYHVLFTEAWSNHAHRRDNFSRYDPVALKRIARGSRTTAQQYVSMLDFRRRLQKELHAALASIDVLLMPSTPATAPDLEDLCVNINSVRVPMYEAQSRATIMCNLSGFPALTIPSGVASDGLPSGVQFVARPWCEDKMLSIAQTLQAHIGLADLVSSSRHEESATRSPS